MNPINWNETYTNISPKLLGICRRYIKDIATAEDIVQDSFMVAIQKENTLKDVAAINGWLSKIVINMAIHHLKTEKKMVFSTVENHEIADNSITMNILALDNKSMILASDLNQNDILEAIDHLPEHHKLVFNMYIIDQFSHIEIAKVLSISVGTSKSCLSRARKSLQAFLLERVKGKPVDEEKKRWLIFFLILGFGNAMFANFYKKLFQNFELKTKKTFSFTKKYSSLPSVFVGLKKSSFNYKTLLIAGIFLSVGLLFYILKTAEKEKELIKKQQVVKSYLPKESRIKVSVKTNRISAKKEVSSLKMKSKSHLSNVKSGKKSINKPKITFQIISENKKDSVKKIVIIKRQIIKKDTVYVTK